MVRTTGKESVKLSKKLPNTIRKRLPSPNYQTYLTPHQFEALAPTPQNKEIVTQVLEEGGHERGKAREAKGRHTHLGACTMLKVPPKEHPGRRRRSREHHAGHEGQQQREQGGVCLSQTVVERTFELQCIPPIDKF